MSSKLLTRLHLFTHRPHAISRHALPRFSVMCALSCVLVWGCDADSALTSPDLGMSTSGAEVSADIGAHLVMDGYSASPVDQMAGEIAGDAAGDMAGAAAGAASDSDALPCGAGPPCQQGYECLCALADACECLAPMNRGGCDDDTLCRRGEECRAFTNEVSGHVDHVCWLDPEALTVNAARSAAPDLPLLAGASSMVITPQGFETARLEGLDGVTINFNPPLAEGSNLWNDCGYDGLCPDDAEYSGPDPGEGDGELQGAFLAGISHGRPAQYCPEELIGCDRLECCVSKLAHDDLMAQMVVLRRGDLTLGFIALDIFGLFHTDVERIRAELAYALRDHPELGHIDHLIIGASHNHESPDSIGQYGAGLAFAVRSGRDARWMAYIRAQVTRGLIESLRALRPVRAESTIVDEGIRGLGMRDSRTPYIFDDNIPTLRLVDVDEGSVVATLLSVANHTEFLWSNNPYITADYLHYTRRYLNQGLAAVLDEDGAVRKPELTGWDGVVVMFVGALGGLINPGRATAITYAGESINDTGFAMADAAGQQIAARILQAHQRGEFREVGGRVERGGTTAPMSYASKRLLTPIENMNFLLGGFTFKLFKRDVYNSTHRGGVSFFPDYPQVMSEVSAVKLGHMSFFTAPGEVFPELLTGGYPDRPSVQTPVRGDVEERMTEANCDDRGLPEGVAGSVGGSSPCVVKGNQSNPPDWSRAPHPPYGYELLPGHPFFIGLGNDFLGYIVPTYDFQDGGASGDHYEETNSASQYLAPHWLEALRAVAQQL